MPIQSCQLNISINKHEIDHRGTPMFPCAGYITNVGDHMTQNIPWHWHEEVEVLVVCSGTLKLELPGKCHHIQTGEGAFINSGVLQSAAHSGNEPCLILSLVFQPSIIAGVIESAFEQRYVRPLLRSVALAVVHFQNSVKWHKEAVRYISDAFEAYRSEPFGYEFLVREKLSCMWLSLVKNHQEVLREQLIVSDADCTRLKDMLAFIHVNYAEPLSLHDIANAAAIGERESLRCFKRGIGISPIQYLLQHRISVAADMLVNSCLHITEIGSQTGFESPSYFSFTFKKLVGMTPKEYRSKTQNRPLS